MTRPKQRQDYPLPPAPYLVCDLLDEGELSPLLLLGDLVAFLGRGEAALRRQAEPVEIDEPGRLLDAALDGVLGLERAGLAGNQSEHRHLGLRQEAQRLGAAGPRPGILPGKGPDGGNVEN